MRDVIITARTDGYEIDKSGDVLGISSENLQGKIIFKPEPFINGACRMHIDGKGSILLNKEDDCYTLPILNSLLSIGDFSYCFKITQSETEEGIPIFATRIADMQVLDTIADETEIPEQYPTWIETLDSKIAEIEKLEEAVIKNENTRIEAETARANTETIRTKNETERFYAETTRATAESTRKKNESDRVINENGRKEAETVRDSAEKIRKINESERIENENGRKEAEKNRETNTANAIAEIKNLNEDYKNLAEEKETELNELAEGVKNFATAIQFATFDVDDNMELGINTAENLENTSFVYNSETGELEVEIV